MQVLQITLQAVHFFRFQSCFSRKETGDKSLQDLSVWWVTRIIIRIGFVSSNFDLASQQYLPFVDLPSPVFSRDSQEIVKESLSRNCILFLEGYLFLIKDSGNNRHSAHDSLEMPHHYSRVYRRVDKQFLLLFYRCSNSITTEVDQVQCQTLHENSVWYLRKCLHELKGLTSHASYITFFFPTMNHIKKGSQRLSRKIFHIHCQLDHWQWFSARSLKQLK